MLREANVLGIVNSVEEAKDIINERSIIGNAKYGNKTYEVVGSPAYFRTMQKGMVKFLS